MGGGGANDEQDLRTLYRVVMWLFALANLAERAAGRSVAVRAAVLWLLRPAEAIARDYLDGWTECASSGDEATMQAFADDGPAGAIDLARGFRAIAAALLTVAETICALCQLAVGADRAGIPIARTPVTPPPRWTALAVPVFDTS